MKDLWADVRYGWRMLGKKPGPTLIILAVLAGGIGINTAVFSIVNAVLLRPLPFPEPDRLVLLSRFQISPANYLDLREQNRSFAEVGAFSDNFYNLSDGAGDAERLVGLDVSPSLWRTLGVTPIRGRLFSEEEGKYESDNLVIITEGLWRRRYGARADVVGGKVTLNSSPYTIIGVVPQDLPFSHRRPEIYLPLRPSAEQVRNREGRYLIVIGRLNRDVAEGVARGELDLLADRLKTQYPAENSDFTAKMYPLHRQIVGEVRGPLLLLLAAVSFVLLIACANVANMLSARALARRREMSIRAALGASRVRLARQLLTESTLLAVLGGAGGLLLAQWGTDLLLALQTESLPRLTNVGLDRRAFAFTASVTAATAFLCGLIPAWQAAKIDVQEELRESGKTTSGRRRGALRGALVVFEITLALVLLIGAGLMIESVRRLLLVDPGFHHENVVAMNLTLPDRTDQSDELAAATYEQILRRVEELPGVAAAGLSHSLPMSGEEFGTGYEIVGRSVPPGGETRGAIYQRISPGYLGTMGIRVVRGRDLTARDRPPAPGAMLINEALARRDFPGEDPLGKQIVRAGESPAEIVGVVSDVRYLSLGGDPLPEIYFSYLADPYKHMSLVVRGSEAVRDPAQLVPAIRREVSEVSKEIPVVNVRTMNEYVAASISTSRFYLSLFGAFAAAAVALAALGIYGVMSQTVAQRSCEIAIRMALGARGKNILTIIVGQGMRLALIGVAAGLVIAAALSRVLGGLLYGVSPLDPAVYVGLAVLLLIVAAAACYLPARRAVRIDPLDALREE